MNRLVLTFIILIALPLIIADLQEEDIDSGVVYVFSDGDMQFNADQITLKQGHTQVFFGRGSQEIQEVYMYIKDSQEEIILRGERGEQSEIQFTPGRAGSFELDIIGYDAQGNQVTSAKIFLEVEQSDQEDTSGLIDVGIGYLDPETNRLFSYQGTFVRYVSQEEVEELLKETQESTSSSNDSEDSSEEDSGDGSTTEQKEDDESDHQTPPPTSTENEFIETCSQAMQERTSTSIHTRGMNIQLHFFNEQLSSEQRLNQTRQQKGSSTLIFGIAPNNATSISGTPEALLAVSSSLGPTFAIYAREDYCGELDKLLTEVEQNLPLVASLEGTDEEPQDEKNETTDTETEEPEEVQECAYGHQQTLKKAIQDNQAVDLAAQELYQAARNCQDKTRQDLLRLQASKVLYDYAINPEQEQIALQQLESIHQESLQYNRTTSRQALSTKIRFIFEQRVGCQDKQLGNEVYRYKKTFGTIQTLPVEITQIQRACDTTYNEVDHHRGSSLNPTQPSIYAYILEEEPYSIKIRDRTRLNMVIEEIKGTPIQDDFADSFSDEVERREVNMFGWNYLQEPSTQNTVLYTESSGYYYLHHFNSENPCSGEACTREIFDLSKTGLIGHAFLTLSNHIQVIPYRSQGDNYLVDITPLISDPNAPIITSFASENNTYQVRENQSFSQANKHPSRPTWLAYSDRLSAHIIYNELTQEKTDLVDILHQNNIYPTDEMLSRVFWSTKGNYLSLIKDSSYQQPSQPTITELHIYEVEFDSQNNIISLQEVPIQKQLFTTPSSRYIGPNPVLEFDTPTGELIVAIYANSMDDELRVLVVNHPEQPEITLSTIPTNLAVHKEDNVAHVIYTGHGSPGRTKTYTGIITPEAIFEAIP